MTPEFKSIEAQMPFEPMPMHLIPYDKFWGDYFSHTKEKPCKNYFLSQMSKNSRYAVGQVRHIINFMDTD